jgi:hypothetical protein
MDAEGLEDSLDATMAEVIATLSVVGSDDWEFRSAALQTIVRTCQVHVLFTMVLTSDQTLHFDTREHRIFFQLLGPLLMQLTDRRSRILKETCETITALCSCMAEAFSRLWVELFPALCKQLIVTIKVVRRLPRYPSHEEMIDH